MVASSSRKLVLTLLVSLALILAISTPVNANDFVRSQRDHANLKRIIKRRAPLPVDNPLTAQAGVIGAGSDPATLSLDANSATSSTASATSASSIVTTSSAASTTTSASASSTSAASSASSSASSSIVSSTSAASSTTASATSTSTTAQQTTATSEHLNVNGETDSATAATRTSSKAIVTETQLVAAAASSSAAAAQTAAAKTKSTTLTILIVVASSVAGVAILWTIFRKWKLGRSSKFDERLQPIDWQPTASDEGIVPHRRTNSRASSFHSSGHGHDNTAGRGVGGYGATSDYGHGGSDHGHGISALQPLPDHDFTAGSTLAPIGGYADLARGPSPQPQMHEALSRGPSVNRGYDVGVPIHHQAAYGAHDAYDYNGGAVRY